MIPHARSLGEPPLRPQGLPIPRFSQGPPPVTGLVPLNQEYSTGELGFSISQSLWKDSFGGASSLKTQRESVSERMEKISLQIQKTSTGQ